ncbi:hypothetical protein [Brevibacterium zhoupengii]|uniref:hypothetical protein n=1 Tax=Brevibacterium zhoupengii TaxID=2898795 RepID=UPI001E31F9B8|nr:hypothetical protein [Brevibacterium zhoupengii]
MRVLTLLRLIWAWRKLRAVKALLKGSIITLLIVFAAALPFVPDPDDFEKISTLIYVRGGFLIASVYIVISAAILLCVPLFRKSKHPRRTFTQFLRITRNAAVGGGIAVLASAMAFVSDDLLRVFSTWVVLSVFLYTWGYLFMDGAFSPEDFQPVSDSEILDAAIAMSEAKETRSENGQIQESGSQTSSRASALNSVSPPLN